MFVKMLKYECCDCCHLYIELGLLWYFRLTSVSQSTTVTFPPQTLVHFFITKANIPTEECNRRSRSALVGSKGIYIFVQIYKSSKVAIWRGSFMTGRGSEQNWWPEDFFYCSSFRDLGGHPKRKWRTEEQVFRGCS
jgi:hypothetical protein